MISPVVSIFHKSPMFCVYTYWLAFCIWIPLVHRMGHHSNFPILLIPVATQHSPPHPVHHWVRLETSWSNSPVNKIIRIVIRLSKHYFPKLVRNFKPSHSCSSNSSSLCSSFSIFTFLRLLHFLFLYSIFPSFCFSITLFFSIVFYRGCFLSLSLLFVHLQSSFTCCSFFDFLSTFLSSTFTPLCTLFSFFPFFLQYNFKN